MSGKKWFSFDEIKDHWNVSAFEILKAFKNGMSPYHAITGEIFPYDIKTHPEKGQTWGTVFGRSWHMIILNAKLHGKGENFYFDRVLRDPAIIFDLQDIKRQKIISKSKLVNSISENKNLRWQDITVTFISDTEIHLQYAQNNTTRHYNMAGFSDGRGRGHGKKPIDAWTTLLEVSKKGGALPWRFETRKKIEKLAQEIRKKLRALFPGIDSRTDPIPINKKDCEYKTAFHLKPPNF